jgi:hypothetical protein
MSPLKLICHVFMFSLGFLVFFGVLDRKENAIGDDGHRCFADALTLNRGLKRLNLSRMK